MSSVSFGSVALHSSNESAGKVSKMQKKKMHYFFSIIDNHVWCRKPSPVSLWFTLPFSFELADGMTAQFEFHLDFNQLFVVRFFFFFSYEPWHSLRPQNRSGRRRRRRSRRRNKRRKRNPSGEIQVTPKRENGRNVLMSSEMAY